MRTEKVAWSANGLYTIILIFLLGYLIAINLHEKEYIFVIIFILIIIILIAGLTIVRPNEAKVILLFGQYLGTLRQEGLKYTIPFTVKKSVSLKVQSFTTTCSIQQKNQTNLLQLVVFYKIVDTARASFKVEQREQFIRLQSETIVKLLWAEKSQSLNENNTQRVDEIGKQLHQRLQTKLIPLGIDIVDLYIVS